MKLPYLSEIGYTTLFDQAPVKLEKYTSEKNEWVLESLLNTNYKKESRIDAVLPRLNNDSTLNGEISNVMIMYDSLRDKLNPRQASNPYLWTYLTHFDYWEYTQERWFSNKEEPSLENVRNRYFCGTEKGSRIGLLRNSISRLWWIGYLTYDDNQKNPYELTKVLFTNSDLVQSILERKYSMNKSITRGILLAIKEINDDPKYEDVGVWKKAENNSTSPKYEWRELCKYINRLGAVTLLDTLGTEQIKELSYKYILDIRK